MTRDDDDDDVGAFTMRKEDSYNANMCRIFGQ